MVKLLSPVVLLFSLREAKKTKDWRYFWQRMGWRFPAFDQSPIWFHCASVGEVKAATPLVRAVSAQHPNTPIVVSTGTPTGAVICEQTLGTIATHVYLPFDTSSAVNRFLTKLRPKTAIIFETEIWPTLFARSRRQNIPLVIVNGRLSNKTLNAPRWIRSVYMHTLQFVTAVLARSPEDAAGFETLGVANGKIETIGNIKFAASTPKEPDSFPDLIGHPYWLAASTHQGEEAILARQARTRFDDKDTLLVIAPRHPKRLAEIEQQLRQQEVNYRVRSRGEEIEPDTQIYLADTLGELDALMAHSRFVFMGGSLVEVGGHNLLEPASLGKAIISGAHLHNFKAEAQLLSSHEAILIAGDETELKTLVLQLLGSTDECARLGALAASAVAGNGAVLEKYLGALEHFIPAG